MHELSSGAASTIESALNAGQKIEAIKLYREATGVDLRTAKESVEHMQAAMNDGGAIVTDPQPVIRGGVAVPEESAAALTAALFAGNKIEAIKIYRNASGGGLKEAKQAMDALEADLRKECPENFTFAAKQGCLGLILFGGLLATCAGYVVA